MKWGEVWTPGANWATTLKTNKDIKLNGHPLPKGKYSVWMVPRRHESWTVVFDTTAQRYHTNLPDTNAVRLRFPVQVQQGPFTQVLTWSFPDMRVNGGTLLMQWGTAKVAVDVAVESSLKATISAAEAKPYVGRYSFARPGSSTPRDFIVTLVNDTLKGEWDRNDVGDGEQELLVEYMGSFALLRIAPDWFVPGLFDEHGQIYEVLRPEMVFQFTREGGQVNSFEVRNAKDKLRATGKRKN